MQFCGQTDTQAVQPQHLVLSVIWIIITFTFSVNSRNRADTGIIPQIREKSNGSRVEGRKMTGVRRYLPKRIKNVLKFCSYFLEIQVTNGIKNRLISSEKKCRQRGKESCRYRWKERQGMRLRTDRSRLQESSCCCICGRACRRTALHAALDCAALGLSALVWLSPEWLFGWGVSACFFDVLPPVLRGVFFLSQTGEKLSPSCG